MPFRVVGYNKPIDDSSLAAMKQSVLDLVQWTTYEFQQIASQFVGTEADKVWTAAPPKPRTGTQAYADGTHWNPGAGEGFYEYTSTGWLPMFARAATGAIVSVKTQRFTANGTYTPSAGMVYCTIECVGGGGAGGAANSVAVSTAFIGGGGGSGGYSRGVHTAAAIGVSQTVTIGAGGTGTSGIGNSGTQTSVGSLITANGGIGGASGVSGSVPNPGAGASSGLGNVVAAAGMPGTGGLYNLSWNTSTILNATGNGGSSIFGGGGSSVWGNIAGTAATGYGSGGAGGTSTGGAGAFTGGAGSAGIVVVTEFCNQ